MLVLWHSLELHLFIIDINNIEEMHFICIAPFIREK